MEERANQDLGVHVLLPTWVHVRVGVGDGVGNGVLDHWKGIATEHL